jgi:DNA-binding Lrp family transcriptional regulator
MLAQTLAASPADADQPAERPPSTGVRQSGNTTATGRNGKAGEDVANRVEAYILVQTAVNAGHVARDIRDVDGVDSADDVSGPYDVIVRASAADMDSLGQLVVARIQSVEGITRTLTCPIVKL